MLSGLVSLASVASERRVVKYEDAEMLRERHMKLDENIYTTATL